MLLLLWLFLQAVVAAERSARCICVCLRCVKVCLRRFIVYRDLKPEKHSDPKGRISAAS